MALSNLDKDNLTRLFKMINIDDYSDNQNAISNIKKDYSNYGKLELIAKQISYLQNQAIEICNNHQLTSEINAISCNFKKAPGTIYYLYETNHVKFLSLISNQEWCSYDRFICKVLYDYDYNFTPLEI